MNKNVNVYNASEAMPYTYTLSYVKKEKETIQNWVKRIFGYVFRHNLLSEKEIKCLHDKDYSKSTFDIQFALLVDRQNDTKPDGYNRYWQKPIEGYYVCSQWQLGKDLEYDMWIRRWLNRVLPDYIELGLDRHDTK